MLQSSCNIVYHLHYTDYKITESWLESYRDSILLQHPFKILNVWFKEHPSKNLKPEHVLLGRSLKNRSVNLSLKESSLSSMNTLNNLIGTCLNIKQSFSMITISHWKKPEFSTVATFWCNNVVLKNCEIQTDLITELTIAC